MNLQDYRKQVQKTPAVIEAEKELNPLLDLADQVLRLRLERGWSQEELAQRVGTRQANISKLESGLANPTYQFLVKLMKAFDTGLSISLKKRQEPEFSRIIPVVVEKRPWDAASPRGSWKHVHSKIRQKSFELTRDR